MANVAYGPEPLAAIAPGCDVKDDGNGAYLTDGFTEDLIRETLLDPDKGFRYKAPVVCGPYKLKSVDLTTETVELEINEFKNAKICENCGAASNKNNDYCPKCGHKF